MSDFAYNKVHLIGVGGISMSGIAKVLLEMGVEVTGSDMNSNDVIEKLQKMGAKIHIGHAGSNIDSDVDMVVVTAAIPENNIEMVAAIKRELPVWKRSQFMGFLMREKIGICVSGMHGKSTTSSIISELLYRMDEDPTVLIGAVNKELKSNSRYGKSDLLVAEACEFDRSFLDFEPKIAVILNIEEEHLDTYKGLDDIVETFSSYCKKVPDDGLLVGCLDDENVQKVFVEQTKMKVGYGFAEKPENFSGVYWQIVDFKVKNATSTWKIKIDDELEDREYVLTLPGEFNVLNATAALIVADFLVLDMDEVKDKLIKITGSVRRFDVLGEKDGVLVIDDYGHHPTEIRNAIKAVRDFYPKKKLYTLFWPHQYNRTEQFFDQFVESFDMVDKLVILDVYEARICDTDKSKYNSKILSENIGKRGVDVEYIPNYEEALEYLKKNIEKDSVLLTIGAGPVDEAAKLFMKK